MQRLESPPEPPPEPADLLANYRANRGYATGELLFFFASLSEQEQELIHAAAVAEKRALAEGRDVHSRLREFNARMDAV